MKRLYALLVILIILYIGINVAADNLPFTDSQTAPENNASSSVSVGEGGFPKLDNFTDTKINDTAVSYKNPKNNMTINLTAIDNSKDISTFAGSGSYTSNQTIDQNGVTAYFFYNEGVESYSADIYFNKNNQNYLISGSDISYSNSDDFINHCKGIIDAINGGQNSNGLSRW